MTTTRKPAKHPNRIPFEGLLTRLDVPSDKAPTGARGHRVILTTAAAEEALDSLVGMAVSFKREWDGHDARQKCGVITRAWIQDSDLRVRGHIFGHDFPEVAAEMRKSKVHLGMSYEMVNAKIEDMAAPMWTLVQVTFTGAAILQSLKAAYKSTRIALITATAEPVTARFNGKLRFHGQGKVKLLKG